jgi:hypothetical protein
VDRDVRAGDTVAITALATFGELTEIAEQVGFRDVECRPAAGDRSVFLARRPASRDDQ